MKRIRTLSIMAMFVLLPMIFYYPYDALAWNLDISFLDMERWTRNSTWVDEDAQVAMSTRIVFFTFWAVPTVFGTVSYIVAFSAVILLRSGIVFDLRIAQRLKWMGICTFFSGATAILAGSLSPMIRSWHNADGPLPLRFWYDSANFGFAFCGLAFLFLGLVMREAISIARENEEFV